MAPLLQQRHHQERINSARTQARIALETGTVEPHPNTTRRLPGDPWRLRGVPVVGVHGGIGGAIPGTKP